MVQDRAVLGSAESRRLRKHGLIPGVLYGREEPLAIAIAERDLRQALTGAGGINAVFDVVVGSGKTHSSILKEYQQDPVRDVITHVDLQEVRLDQPIQVAVSVHLLGEPAGAKEGGIVAQLATEVTIEALPMEIPPHLDFDISELHLNEVARVGEIDLPAGVTLLDDPETLLVGINPPRVEEVVEPVEGEGAEAEGAAADGAEPAADAGGEDAAEG